MDRTETGPGPRWSDLLEKAPAPAVPCTVGIAGATGRCPLGFMEEDTWEVNGDGRLSYPLCRNAVEALRPVLKRLAEGRDFDSRAQCKCPYTGCRLTFVVHAPSIFERMASKPSDETP
jgi:hypothetical protein